jgi:hypothetical protein
MIFIFAIYLVNKLCTILFLAIEKILLGSQRRFTNMQLLQYFNCAQDELCSDLSGVDAPHPHHRHHQAEHQHPPRLAGGQLILKYFLEEKGHVAHTKKWF